MKIRIYRKWPRVPLEFSWFPLSFESFDNAICAVWNLVKWTHIVSPHFGQIQFQANCSACGRDLFHLKEQSSRAKIQNQLRPSQISSQDELRAHLRDNLPHDFNSCSNCFPSHKSSSTPLLASLWQSWQCRPFLQLQCWTVGWSQWEWAEQNESVGVMNDWFNHLSTTLVAPQERWKGHSLRCKTWTTRPQRCQQSAQISNVFSWQCVSWRCAQKKNKWKSSCAADKHLKTGCGTTSARFRRSKRRKLCGQNAGMNK